MTHKQFRRRFFAAHRLHAQCCIHYERHWMRHQLNEYIERLVDAVPLSWYERAEKDWGNTEAFRACCDGLPIPS